METTEHRTLIYAGREDRNREYKTSFPWQRKLAGDTMAKVAKSILALANLRDGGHIVIGVSEPATGSTAYQVAGVDKDHLPTFSFDVVADFARNYAEPYARFALDIVSLDGKEFVVISVEGFDEFPVICKQSYGDILGEGVVYVRPLGGRPRSAPVSNYADMRELLDVAVERGVRRFFRTQAAAGGGGPSDEEQFNKQRKGF